MYHSHYYSGKTSFNDGHRHKFKGETSSAPTGVPHVHYIVGYTTHEDGHRHYYAIQTSPDYDVEGGHIHYISGITYISRGYISQEHYHYMNSDTHVGPE